MKTERSVQEILDRIAIRELIEAYGHAADRRETEAQTALFTEDAKVIVQEGDAVTATLVGHAQLTAGFAGLRNYQSTTHFIGQSTLVLEGVFAHGETYCLAHHVLTDAGQRILLIMSIRYLDKFACVNSHWLFSERRLIIDWTDRRPSSP